MQITVFWFLLVLCFFLSPKKEIFAFQVDLERGDKGKHFMDVQIKIVQFILTNISWKGFVMLCANLTFSYLSHA